MPHLKNRSKDCKKIKPLDLKDDLKKQVEVINGVNFLATEVNLDQSSIKDLAFALGTEIENLFFIVGTKNEDKAMLTVYISKNIVNEDLHAGKIVRELGKLIHGGGGGQPFYATAGGKNPEGIKEALNQSKKLS